MKYLAIRATLVAVRIVLLSGFRSPPLGAYYRTVPWRTFKTITSGERPNLCRGIQHLTMCPPKADETETALERCVGSSDYRQHLSSMSHDDVYVLDASLITCYKENKISEWNKFVDEHLAMGKKFFMVSFSCDEVEGGCPEWCEVIETDQPVTVAGMEPFYKRVLEKFGVKGNMRVKLKTDIMSLGAAGFVIASAPEHQISIEDIKADKVVYLTHNLNVLEGLLGGDDKIKLFEKLVDESGLEHLIALRGVFNDGTCKNYW